VDGMDRPARVAPGRTTALVGLKPSRVTCSLVAAGNPRSESFTVPRLKPLRLNPAAGRAVLVTLRLERLAAPRSRLLIGGTLSPRQEHTASCPE
jgi:hypothetical protein